MNLGELIRALEKHPICKRINNGFGKASSYRGNYSYLAFEPKKNVDVHYMLLQAKSAVGTTKRGYKGGRFKMTLDTPVFIAHIGCCTDNDAITEHRLASMLAGDA